MELSHTKFFMELSHTEIWKKIARKTRWINCGICSLSCVAFIVNQLSHTSCILHIEYTQFCHVRLLLGADVVTWPISSFLSFASSCLHLSSIPLVIECILHSLFLFDYLHLFALKFPILFSTQNLYVIWFFFSLFRSHANYTPHNISSYGKVTAHKNTSYKIFIYFFFLNAHIHSFVSPNFDFIDYTMENF